MKIKMKDTKVNDWEITFSDGKGEAVNTKTGDTVELNSNEDLNDIVQAQWGNTSNLRVSGKKAEWAAKPDVDNAFNGGNHD